MHSIHIGQWPMYSTYTVLSPSSRPSPVSKPPTPLSQPTGSHEIEPKSASWRSYTPVGPRSRLKRSVSVSIATQLRELYLYVILLTYCKARLKNNVRQTIIIITIICTTRLWADAFEGKS